MNTYRRRSLLRAAAVTTVGGGAFLLPAVAAVADSPARVDGTRTVAPDARQVHVAPKGEAAPQGGTGTEGFHSGDPAFLAAGGAMAAAGAAGLGYAMLRRGRTDA
ncbi:hypothetical protein [Streptomyces sp. NPDC048436]|uniref:hypothetical protein n=1 Tax=Streptomyces sp. NPDC048436 TaxID=3365550 RepID=UPI00371E5349